ncbi:MAG: hypothetical protein C0482_04975 [Gordonia sp.]|nr:hypothetical protein [Gordonia sp. (in: high G+C Gram-positive bacteria)]
MAGADTVGAYTSLEGQVKFSTTAAGLLTVTATGLNPTVELEGVPPFARSCIVLGTSDNANGGEGTYFISGLSEIKSDGSWTTNAWGQGQTATLPVGDYKVSVRCQALVGGEFDAFPITDPVGVDIKLDGTGTAPDEPEEPENPGGGSVEGIFGGLF